MDHPRLVGIFLAAGKSSRMGCSKLNLPLGNKFVGSMAFEAALDSNLDITIAVTRKGDSLHWFTPFSKMKGWRLLECQHADEGLSASLKVGVRAASQLGAAGVLVILADQPNITVQMINRLVEEFSDSQDYDYISFTHKGIAKPPLLMSRKLFPFIERLEGDQGAREIIRGRERGSGKHLMPDGNDCFFDVDTMEDYQYLKEKWQSQRRWEG